MIKKLLSLSILRHHLFITALRIINRSVKQAAFLFLFSLMAFGTQAQVVQQLQNFKGLDGATDVAVSPDNNHLYVVGQTDDAIVVFSRNTGTGALTFVEILQDGIGGVDGLDGAYSVTVSPDNNHVYTVGNDDHAITVFSRNTTTGALTFVEVLKDGVGGVDGLLVAESVTVSPDNNHVYAVGNIDHAIAVFSRNTTTGALTFVEVQKDGVGGVDGLYRPTSVMVSPDNNHVYASGESDDAIAVFSRNTTTGALTFVEMQKDGVGGVDGLNGAHSVMVSPDNNHLYVASEGDDAIAVFSRNTTTGALTFVEMQKDGVGGVDGLDGAYSVTVSPDNNHVYAAGVLDDAIAAFSRNTTTGALTFVGMLKDGVGGVDELDGAWNVTVSPDNNHVYTASFFDDAIAAFSRNTGTGVLTFVEYISNTGATNPSSAKAVRGLTGARGTAVSPDNNHLYVASEDDDAIAVFSRNTGTGALTFVDIQKDGIGGVDGLNNARNVTVSPDNNHVYVVGSADNAIAVFSQNTGTGALTFVEMQQDGVGGVDGLSNAISVTVSPDNNHVYAAGFNDDAIAVFSRNTGTGALTFVEMQKDGIGGVELDGAMSVTVSTDNNFLYAVSNIDDGLVVFEINSGSLLPVELTYFTGQATATGNLLQWQTASEENNAGFEVERGQVTGVIPIGQCHLKINFANMIF